MGTVVGEPQWLTSFSSAEEVPRNIETYSFSMNKFITLFEVWNATEYLYTAYQLSNQSNMVKICSPIRLNKSAALFGGSIIRVLSGGESLEVYDIKIT